MASSYTEGLVIELIGSGDKAGSWGDVTNNNLKSLNQGITGFSEVDLSEAGTSYTIDLSDAQVPDESTSPSRSSIIKFINVPDTPTPFEIDFQVNAAPAQRINCVVINGDDNNTISLGTGANGDRLTILNGYAASVYSEVNSGNSSYFDIKNSFANLSVDKIALENNEIIGNATNDTITIGASILEIGDDGTSVAIIQNAGDNSADADLLLRSTNSSGGSIRIGNGSSENIVVDPQGGGDLQVVGGVEASGNVQGSTLTATTNGLDVTAGGIDVTAGGINVTAGGLDLNDTGITNTGSIGGLTSITATGNISTSGNISTTGSGTITSAGQLTVSSGGIDVNGGSLDLANGGINNPGTITMGSGGITGGTISSSAINGTPVGQGTPSNGAFTTLSSTLTADLNAVHTAEVVGNSEPLEIKTTGGGHDISILANSASVEIVGGAGGTGEAVTLSADIANVLVNKNNANSTGNLYIGQGSGNGVLRVGGQGTGGSYGIISLGFQDSDGTSQRSRIVAPLLTSGESPTSGLVTQIAMTGTSDAADGNEIRYNVSTAGEGNSSQHQFYVGNMGSASDIRMKINDDGVHVPELTSRLLVGESDSDYSGNSYICATGGFRSSTYTGRVLDVDTLYTSAGTGRTRLTSSSTSTSPGSEAVEITASDGRLGLNATSSSQLITTRIGGDLQFVVNSDGAFLHEDGGRYLNFNSGTAVQSNGLRGSNNYLEIKNKIGAAGSAGVDDWGLAYHSGASDGDGVYSEKEFSSANLVAGTVTTITTGLSTVPKIVTAYLECTDGDLGYVSGDSVLVSSTITTGNVANDTGLSLVFNGNNVTLVVGDGGIRLLQKSGADPGGIGTIDTNDWKLVVKAYK